MSRFTEPLKTSATPNPDILLDSGAYSVWRSGKQIELRRFQSYVRRVAPMLLGAVNLDEIPGAYGRRPTVEEAERACEVSYRNWEQLERETGVPIMPVFHQGDSLKWLDAYIEAGAQYICISPVDSFSTPVRQKWLIDAHEYLDRLGVLNKSVFTHCLGVFAPKVLHVVPAWSADASSIIRFAVWKRIMIPKRNAHGQVWAWESALLSEHTQQKEAVDWQFVADYLDSVKVPWRWKPMRQGILLEDDQDFIRVNLALAYAVMGETRIRCFIAGEDRPSMYRVIVEEAYPYILRSFAPIKEQTGDTIKRVHERSIPKPPRRREQDRKVVAARGLFAQ